MAEVPNQPFASVSPDDQVPDDYQRVSTSPEMFGGAIAKGTQELGQGALTASKFFDTSAADQAFNNTQDSVNKILHGDPTVKNPDGTPDTGYFGLEGQAAMDARAGVTAKINDIIAQNRQSVSTPEGQNQYDNYSRRWNGQITGQIGTYADTQSKTWAQSVNADSAALAANGIAQDIDDPEKVKHHTADLVNAEVKNAELHGAQKGDPVWTAAVTSGQQKALAAQVTTIGVKDPARAQKLLDDNKSIAGDTYDNLSKGLQERADQQVGIAAGSAALGSAQIKANPTAAIPPTQGDPYALVPKKGSKGEDQASMFHLWNPDPVGNNAANLKTVNPALQAVYARALHDNPNLKFVVGSGARTADQQAQAIQWGWSNAADSDHLTGNAFDLWPVNGKGQVYFDPKTQGAIGQAMKKAAGELGIQMQWGGDFLHPDPTHYQVAGGTNYNQVTAAPGGAPTQPAAKPDLTAGPKAPILGGTVPTWATAGTPGGAPAPIGLPPPAIPQAASGAPVSTQSLVDHIDGFLKMPGYTNRLVEIESGGKPWIVNKGSGAAGLAQFIPSTWAKFGHGDPLNPADNLAALARLTQANYQSLRLGLGREPTGGELYLAHQQGAGGAVNLLKNPDAPAASIVGLRAVISNGGTQGMTAGQFAAKWINTFNKTPGKPLPAYAQAGSGLPISEPGGLTLDLPQFVQPGATPAAPPPSSVPSSPEAPAGTQPVAAGAGPTPTEQKYDTMKSDAYAAILRREQLDQSDPNYLSPQAGQHAFQTINQAARIQQMHEVEQAKQKKDANDQAADEYTTAALTGKATPDILAKIGADPRLTWETKHALAAAVQTEMSSDATANTVAYGPAYWDTYKRIMQAPGTPGRLSDPTELYGMAVPGQDGQQQLNMKGVAQLRNVMESLKKPDQQGTETAKVNLMEYAKGFLSFNQDQPPLPGMPVVKDPEGEAEYRSIFVPKFEAAYNDWTVRQGKSPFDFLTKENMDKFIQNTPGLRTKTERDAALVAATKQAAMADGTPVPDITAPPKYTGDTAMAPSGISAQKWDVFARNPPVMADGKYLDQETWKGIATKLLSDPNPGAKAWFNHLFGPQGHDADRTILLLGTNFTPGAGLPNEEVGNHHQINTGFTPLPPHFGTGKAGGLPGGLGVPENGEKPEPLFVPRHKGPPVAEGAGNPTLLELAGKYPAPGAPRQDADTGAGWSPPVTGGR